MLESSAALSQTTRKEEGRKWRGFWLSLFDSLIDCTMSVITGCLLDPELNSSERCARVCICVYKIKYFCIPFNGKRRCHT